MNMMETGRRISALRKDRNMTQLDLADRMGVSYQAVSSWERGLTMPDITKLPELAGIFGVSIDALVGNAKQAEVLEHAANGTLEGFVAVHPMEEEEIREIAPLLQPEQVGEIMNKEISMDSLCGLAPFTSRAVLERLVLSAAADYDFGELCGIAPFVSREALDTLAQRVDPATGGFDELSGLAPFLSKEVLSGLVEMVGLGDSGLDEISGLAPFLSKESLDRLVIRASGLDEPQGNGPRPEDAARVTATAVESVKEQIGAFRDDGELEQRIQDVVERAVREALKRLN